MRKISLIVLYFYMSISQAQEVVTYKYSNHEGKTQSVEAIMRKPVGASNDRAIVILHHSGGFSTGTTSQYAEFFSYKGYTTLEPRMYNTPSQRQDTAEHLSQAMGGLKFLATQPGVDKEKISVMGLSFGSFLAVFAGTEWATQTFTEGKLKFNKIAPLYAVCWLLEKGAKKELGTLRNKFFPIDMYDKWSHVPLKFFVGSEDNYDDKDPKTCPNFIEAIPDAKQRSLSSVNVYKATHGWDQQTSTFFATGACKGKGRGCNNTNQSNPEVTAKVKEDLLKFIDE
jgi:dienelactone hydrolase